MIFVVLWTAIIAFLATYLLKSPKVRSWLKVLIRAKLLRRVIICTTVIIAAIIIAYKVHPVPEIQSTDDHSVFMEYSAKAVNKIASTENLTLDSSCDLSRPKSELSYILPLILNTYADVVDKPTKPVLVRLDDTLQIELRGYKQFKNRGFKLKKLLQKKLGNRYKVAILSDESTTHTLQISYEGTPWNKEQLIALPVMEAAKENQVDPALLMSLIRHVSNFDFNFRGPKDTHGLLAMGGHKAQDHIIHANDPTEKKDPEIDGLNQIFEGAKRLGKQLQVLSLENTIATFYPEQGMNYTDAQWTKSPLIKSWVDQVMADIQFYHENGLKPLD